MQFYYIIICLRIAEVWKAVNNLKKNKCVTVTFLKLLFMGLKKKKGLRTDLSVDFGLEGDLGNKA